MRTRHGRRRQGTEGGAARAARERGFSLVEVLIAALITGIALVATGWTMSAATSSRAVLDEEPLAYLLAQEIRVLADGLPREPSGVVGVTSVDDVLALDSLSGAVFSPPVRADRSTDASLAGWSQQVELSVCSLDQPQTLTGEAPTSALSGNARRLFRLSVTVTHGDDVIATFRWWLVP